ncbi:hypothetical protein A0U92_16535 [Acetobacter aceti]|uniref:Uncharacterized protein n=1 Tax=Acetobacter aceti TaxID=435 RepID=A0A1U9KJW4_ACEAC|nr:hypothetical protein A0U92_16535 [Acetobacter aceti]
MNEPLQLPDCFIREAARFFLWVEGTSCEDMMGLSHWVLGGLRSTAAHEELRSKSSGVGSVWRTDGLLKKSRARLISDAFPE